MKVTIMAYEKILVIIGKF